MGTKTAVTCSTTSFYGQIYCLCIYYIYITVHPWLPKTGHHL